MNRANPACRALLVVFLLTLSCAGRGNPVVPNQALQRESSRTQSQQLLFGLYDIGIDPAAGVAEVAPLRGADFQINVVKFLQPPVGDAANLKVKLNIADSDPAHGIFDLDISITHPFPGTNLRGFDVRGIVLGKGTQISQFDFDVQYPKPTELRLLNADGYTRWWNPVEFLTPGLFGYTPTLMGSGTPKSTVNGYKYFADDLGPTDPPLPGMASRGTFSTDDGAAGKNTLTRKYRIQFPLVGGVPKVQFRYAICASYLSPEPGSTPPAPVDKYSIDANCPEAYNISVSVDPASTAYYTSVQSGGDLILNVEIFDWQSIENPDGLPGEVGSVGLESPTMWSGVVDPIASGTLGPGTTETSSTWRVEIKNVEPDAEKQDVFISVQSADPNTYAPPMPGVAIYPGGAVLAAYNLLTMTLPGNSAPTVGLITGPDKYAPGTQLEYTLGSMSDLQDGQNLTVTWDFDGDGVFDDDEDGSDTNKKGKYTFTGDTTCQVQCRVTDTALAYTDSNILTVEPISLPYNDPMDSTSQGLWTVQNGLFGYHYATLQWNLQTDHWATNSPTTGYYESDMDTTLISPEIPVGAKNKLTVTISHRYQTDYYYYGDFGRPYYRVNGGLWITTGSLFTNESLYYPAYIDDNLEVGGLSPGDRLQIGFDFQSDYYYELAGWAITNFMVMDNEPPVIENIYGPDNVDSLGPLQFSTVATDLDGIASYMWSVEAEGTPPVYDDPGDGMGNIDVTFPADGKYEIWVMATDAGNPPLSTEWGPHVVAVFTKDPDAFFSEEFDVDPGTWTYTGGIGDGSYQDFWHIDTGQSWLSNVGPDGCFAEGSSAPIPKSASVQVIFPNSAIETRLKIIHKLWVDIGGLSEPWDGQWVTIDGDVVAPQYGFLYDDNGGVWSHGYFVGVTDGWVVSTFVLGTTYNDGAEHTLTFHSSSYDNFSNCAPLEGWQIDYLEFWPND